MKIKFNNTFWLTYLRPTYFYESVDKISVDSLYNEGIRYIFCDLDNTLTPHFSSVPLKSTIKFINQAKAKGIRFFIFSNNKEKRVNSFILKLEKMCKIDGYMSNSMKPLLFKTKKMIKNNLVNLEEVIIIGDQFITDILLANRLNIKSILVNPLLDVSVSNMNIMQRFFEKLIFKNISKNKFNNIEHKDENELL